jgi:hypothetical protein
MLNSGKSIPGVQSVMRCFQALSCCNRHHLALLSFVAHLKTLDETEFLVHF